MPLGFERGVWRAIADPGWASILVPEVEISLGLCVRELVFVVEDVAAGCCPSLSWPRACTSLHC